MADPVTRPSGYRDPQLPASGPSDAHSHSASDSDASARPVDGRTALDAAAIDAGLDKIVAEIIHRRAAEADETQADPAPLAIVGIHTLGVPLSERLVQKLLAADPSLEIDTGSLDITLYRDDIAGTLTRPQVRGTDVSFDVEGKRIVLVDDVCYTGRTARAAIEQLMDFGRPSSVELAVLVDRGHRELPIEPTYVGATIPTSRHQQVLVYLAESDGEDRVVVS